MASDAHPVVLFDGVCNLCNGVVNFLIDHDPAGRLRFAAIQSDAGRALLERLGVPPPAGDPDSVCFVENGRLYDRSAAAIRIVRHLRGPWQLLRVLWFVPRPVRDLGYRFIARHRYRWFGKADACRRPTPALKARFLGEPDPAP